MINTIVASAALLATATVVNAVGSAVVVNQCSFDVTLTNVPASGGGQSQIGPQSLSQGGSYSQVYTGLTNDQGWSIKLSIGNSEPLQYEYTFHNDGTIWYDLSAVNGDPFNGNWFISSGDGCTPKQTAYQYPTDDANGMQSCSDSATVTVTLCGGSGGSAPLAPPAVSPPVSVPTPAIPTPSVPEVPVPDVASPSPDVASPAPDSVVSPPSPSPWGPPADKVGGFNQLEGTPTTFDTVTNVHTKVVTQWITISPSPVHPNKRDVQHLHRHAERHNHF